MLSKRFPLALNLFPWVFASTATLLLLFGALAVSHAAHVNCGDVLGPGGTIVLDTDLHCPNLDPEGEPHAKALTIVGPVTVDLNDHTVSCGQDLRFGVYVTNRVRFRNGRVEGCPIGLLVTGKRSIVENLELSLNELAVHVEGGDRNTFINNIVSHNAEGFWLSDGANHNALSNNTVSDNTETALRLDDGHGNTVIDNTASRNGRGFSVMDQNSELRGNTAQDNAGDGFLVSAASVPPRDAHVLKDNTAIDNGGHGINLDGAVRNRVTENAATGHSAPHFDLRDGSAACDHNQWDGNTFETKSQDCIQ